MSMHFRNVWLSLINELEGTLPQGMSESDTYQILESSFENADINSEKQPWDVDCQNNEKTSPTQLMNRFAAHQSISQLAMLKCDLTVSDVFKAHRMITEDFTGMKGKGGEFRSHNVYATNPVYPEDDALILERGCDLIVEGYNAAVRDRSCFITSAATLFYDMITLHPFSDGNGRLCQLLVSYALKFGGFPSLVPLSSHHRKSRKHCMNSKLQGRKTSKLGAISDTCKCDLCYVQLHGK
jgi:hypothetical protein